MGYDDRRLYTDFYGKKDEYNNIAEQFCEGDPSLQNVLVDLWNHDIKTVACCKGHPEKGLPPYISFVLDNNSADFIQASYDFLNAKGNDTSLEFDNHSPSFTSAIIYLVNEEIKQDFFNFLHYYVNDSKNIEKGNAVVPLYGNYLSRIGRDFGFLCRVSCSNDEMTVSYTPRMREGSPYIINPFDNVKKLSDEEFEKVVEIGVPPLHPFKLENFVDTETFISNFYPEIFVKKNNIK